MNHRYRTLREQLNTLPTTKNVGAVLASVVRERNFEGKMLEQKVFSRWRDVVGEAIANHAHPASLSAGILTVWTAHPAYQTELSFHKVKILAELNALLGRAVVKDLRLEFRPGQAADSSSGEGATVARQTVSPPKPGCPQRALTSETLTQLEVALAGVTDEPLKDALRRLFVTQSEENEHR